MVNCDKCDKNLNDATFLSESFNYDGGTMFFKCECGNETYRSFVPTDLLTDDEKIRVLVEQEMGPDFAKIASAEYRKIQSYRKLRGLKIK